MLLSQKVGSKKTPSFKFMCSSICILLVRNDFLIYIFLKDEFKLYNVGKLQKVIETCIGVLSTISNLVTLRE